MQRTVVINCNVNDCYDSVYVMDSLLKVLK